MILWFIFCILSLLMFVVNNIVELYGLILCFEEWLFFLDFMKLFRNYIVVFFVIFYLFLLIVIFFFYGCVFYRFWKRKCLGNCLFFWYDMIFLWSKWKVLKMFIVVVICFVLCWFFFYVMFFIVVYDNNLYNCGVLVDGYFY